jgi:hypothetical protein
MVDIAANTTTTATFEGSSAVMATFSGELETSATPTGSR